MAFDASPLSTIGDNFNPSGAIQQAYTLKSLADQDQLNQLRLGAAKREQADQDTIRGILKKQDISTPEGLMKASQALQQAGYSDQAMDLLKEGQNQRQSNQQYNEGQLRIVKLTADVIGPAALQIKQTMQTQGPAQARAQYQMLLGQVMPQIPQQVRSRFPAQPPADDQQFAQMLDGAINSSQEARQILSQQRETQFKQDTLEERKTHDRALEAAANRRETDKQQATGFSPQEGALMAALAERGVNLPTGFRSKEQQKALYAGILARNPTRSPDEIADMVAKGQISFGAEKKATSTAAGIAGRTGVAENEILDMSGPVLQASDAVPRGKFVPVNKLLQMKDSSLSDPNLKTLKVRINAMLNAYDQLAARGGTDKNKREEAHSLLTSAESPEALRAGIEAFRQEATIAKGAAERAAGLPSSGTSPRGGGGAGNLPPTNAQGWQLMQDASGNKAYVSPDGKKFQQVQ